MAKPRRRRTRRQRTRAKKQHAKLFWTGRSQAVRLPKEFRFDGDSVLIRREGTKVILEPDNDWPEGWWESFQGVTDWERPPQGEFEKRVELKL